MGGIRIALYTPLANASALGGTVADFAALPPKLALKASQAGHNLRQPRTLPLPFKVGAASIRCQLDAVGKTGAKIIHQAHCAFCTPIATKKETISFVSAPSAVHVQTSPAP